MQQTDDPVWEVTILIQKLRRRLTLLVIGVLILVTAGIVLSIDAINRRNISTAATAALDILANNQGRRPELQSQPEPPEKPEGADDIEPPEKPEGTPPAGSPSAGAPSAGAASAPSGTTMAPVPSRSARQSG